MFETFVGVPFTPENVKNFLGNVPLGRLTDPTDVAKAALFLGKSLEKPPGACVNIQTERSWCYIMSTEFHRLTIASGSE